MKSGNSLKIYLDQNKWIAVAQSVLKPDEYPQYLPVAKRLLEKVDSGEWQVPLSLIHIMETLKRMDLGSRGRLAEVMSSISKSSSILPFTHVEQNEFLNSFAELHDKSKKVMISAIYDHIFGAVGSGMAEIEISKDMPENIALDLKSFFNSLSRDSNFFYLLMSVIQDPKMVKDIYNDEEEARAEWEKLKARFEKLPNRPLKKWPSMSNILFDD